MKYLSLFIFLMEVMHEVQGFETVDGGLREFQKTAGDWLEGEGGGIDEEGERQAVEKLGKYLVSLRRRSRELIFGAGHYCSGAIIREDIILTTASCLYDMYTTKVIPASDLIVVAGCRNRLERTRDVQVMSVSRVQPHNGYFYQSIAYDIGLIQLEDKLLIDGRTVAIVNLPTMDAKDGMSCNLLGWGRAYHDGPRRDSLVSFDMVLLLSEDCQKKIKALNVEKLCAVHKRDNGSNIRCNDHGSPLLCDDIIYGLTSIRLDCGSEYLSTFYEIVLQHVEWIQSIINYDAGDGAHPFHLFKDLNVFLILCSILLVALTNHY